MGIFPANAYWQGREAKLWKQNYPKGVGLSQLLTQLNTRLRIGWDGPNSGLQGRTLTATKGNICWKAGGFSRSSKRWNLGAGVWRRIPACPVQGLGHVGIVITVGRHPNCTEQAFNNNTLLQPWARGEVSMGLPVNGSTSQVSLSGVWKRPLG